MWHTIPLDKIPLEGQVKRVIIKKKEICLATINGFVYAMKDNCPHALASLGNGILEDEYVVCPAHKLKFSMVSGQDKHGIGYKCDTYDTRFKEGAWQIKISRNNFKFW
ncbi:MAG: Rieske 2Fe-2S domain-containing protein [Chitinophagales bacterium]